MLSRITNLDALNTLKWNTKFGEIRYGPVAAIEKNEVVEDVDDDEDFDMQVFRLQNGHFEAKLPFFSDLRPPSNYMKALSLLNKLVFRLLKQNSYDIYRSEFFKYVTSGQAVEISDTDGFFIPHHAVIRPESSSSPIRIVFNASFGHDSSLNNLLWKGSVIGLDVFPHLIRIRLFKFLCTADLKKAFLQISIFPDHRKYLRLLWKELDNRIRKFEMTVLPFGVISSPAILTQVVDRIIHSIPSESSRKLLSGVTYMDDLLIGSNNADDLRNCVSDAQKAFKSSGFELHKICSNISIPESLDEDHVNLLGLTWNNEIAREWTDAIENWPSSDMIKVDRYISDTSTLYCFADASEIAFGFCMYLGNDLIFGKSKIAPKLKTIVEKELLALFELD
ncbi:hypothetical protein BLA29_001917 [Euroglyphus maynei]|uniref:Reverse transcriptase domain-containing protein n=1 Tax=Euroglyphus maynei TaxID=6958 RepID=A0A1Y3BT69_EURMA|nr:hypothetical protein BLA29_001917 [Euroglyphus maynei]